MSELMFRAQRAWFQLKPGARLLVAMWAAFFATVVLMTAVGVL